MVVGMVIGMVVGMVISMVVGTIVRKVAALIGVSKCELYALRCKIASILSIIYLLGFIFFTSFCKYVF